MIKTKQKIGATAPTRPGLSFNLWLKHQLQLVLKRCRCRLQELPNAAGSEDTKQTLLQFQSQSQSKFQFQVTAKAAAVVVAVMANKGTGLQRKELALLLPCCMAAGCSPFMTCTTTEAESAETGRALDGDGYRERSTHTQQGKHKMDRDVRVRVEVGGGKAVVAVAVGKKRHINCQRQ